MCVVGVGGGGGVGGCTIYAKLCTVRRFSFLDTDIFLFKCL